jgi:hypothetical protein
VRGIAIESYLVEGLPPTAPPGFATSRQAIDAVPREFDLSDGWTAILYIPTGIARTWLDSAPDEVVSSSQEEFVPHGAARDDVARAASRLVIRRAGAVLGAMPLAVGATGNFRATSALLEVMLLSWEIRAAAMRGGVPGSARIELAWRSRLIAAGVITGGGTARG